MYCSAGIIVLVMVNVVLYSNVTCGYGGSSFQRIIRWRQFNWRFRSWEWGWNTRWLHWPFSYSASPWLCGHDGNLSVRALTSSGNFSFQGRYSCITMCEQSKLIHLGYLSIFWITKSCPLKFRKVLPLLMLANNLWFLVSLLPRSRLPAIIILSDVLQNMKTHGMNKPWFNENWLQRHAHWYLNVM